MSDFFIKLTPLPQPRPSGLDYTPDAPFTGNLDISDLGDRVWSLPKAGTELMKQQFNELWNSINIYDPIPSIATDIFLFLGLFLGLFLACCVGYLLAVAVKALYNSIKKFW